MREILGLFLCAMSAGAADRLDVFGLHWTVPSGADWVVDTQGGGPVLKMLAPHPPEKDKARKPTQFALADTAPFEHVVLEAEVHRLNTSLILVYAYRDDLHFNYAHLSADAARKQIVHNGIFHVYGGERVRISRADGLASLPSADIWYKVKLTYDAASGVVDVTVNGEPNSSLHGVDLSLGAGQVGLGSFFETAEFRNVHVTGK
jgi:hypothetical protein